MWLSKVHYSVCNILTCKRWFLYFFHSCDTTWLGSENFHELSLLCISSRWICTVYARRPFASGGMWAPKKSQYRSISRPRNRKMYKWTLYFPYIISIPVILSLMNILVTLCTSSNIAISMVSARTWEIKRWHSANRSGACTFPKD